MKIIFATKNQNKMKEIREIMGDLGWDILSMEEAGIEADIDEDGSSFEENALIKAKAVAALCREKAGGCEGGRPGPGTEGAGDKKAADKTAGEEDMPAGAGYIVLADDSGLVIDALGGEPGIYSSRYAGEDTPYEIKNQMILDRMAAVPDEERTARFVCAVAAVAPGHEPIVVRGTFEGYIAHAPAGVNGFGYDPIFWVADRGCTSAELPPEEKNARSHRGNALRAMRERIADADLSSGLP